MLIFRMFRAFGRDDRVLELNFKIIEHRFSHHTPYTLSKLIRQSIIQTKKINNGARKLLSSVWEPVQRHIRQHLTVANLANDLELRVWVIDIDDEDVNKHNWRIDDYRKPGNADMYRECLERVFSKKNGMDKIVERIVIWEKNGYTSLFFTPQFTHQTYGA